jgi:RNA polymerase subunit RPABC4/transcription elongation factor Spt4
MAMDDPILCRVCDRLFDSSFEICPFCGAERIPEESFEEIVDDSFERLEVAARGSTLRRIDALLGQLDAMERELDLMIQESESVSHVQA